MESIAEEEALEPKGTDVKELWVSDRPGRIG
jgi:hypothetical protein